jgi:hypothetical protein
VELSCRHSAICLILSNSYITVVLQLTILIFKLIFMQIANKSQQKKQKRLSLSYQNTVALYLPPNHTSNIQIYYPLSFKQYITLNHPTITNKSQTRYFLQLCIEESSVYSFLFRTRMCFLIAFGIKYEGISLHSKYIVATSFPIPSQCTLIPALNTNVAQNT